MLNIDFKPESIKKKVVRTFKQSLNVKNIATKKGRLTSSVRLSDALVRAVCPALAHTLAERNKEMKKKEAALEREIIQLHIEKAKFDDAKVAEAKKQATIKQGTAILFRDNRIHSQRELVRQQRAADELETALCHVAQDELDKMTVEREQGIMDLLAAAVTQNAITSVALEAKAKAEDMSGRLAKAIAASQDEHLRLQLLRSGVEARYTTLGELVSDAEAKKAKAHEYLRTGMDQCIRFEALIRKLEKGMHELDDHISAAKEDRAEAGQQVHAARVQAARFGMAAQALELTERFVEREHADMLNEAKIEAQRRVVALGDARADFEKLRNGEKASLAKRHVQVEELHMELEKAKRDAKAEKERIRLLGVEAEVERAAAVDAKLAALDELRQAIIIRTKSNEASLIAKQEAAEDLKVAGFMRVGSKWAIDRLFVIAGEMSNITGGSMDVANEPAKEEHGSAGETQETDGDKDGRISRMEVYRDARISEIPERGRDRSPRSRHDTDKIEDIAEQFEGESRSSIVREARVFGRISPQNGGSAKRPTVMHRTKPSVGGDENVPPVTTRSSIARAIGLKLQERDNRGIKEIDTNTGGTGRLGH